MRHVSSTMLEMSSATVSLTRRAFGPLTEGSAVQRVILMRLYQSEYAHHVLERMSESMRRALIVGSDLSRPAVLYPSKSMETSRN